MKRTLLLIALSAFPLLAFAEDAADDFFADAGPLVTAGTASTVDPTAQFSKNSEGLKWGGSVTSSATWTGSWTEWPDPTDPSKNFTQALGYSLRSLLNLDGRPTKDFRFHLGLKTGAPFTNDTSVLTGATYLGALSTTSTTLKVPDIKIWEMYTDVTLADTVFVRFGKQSASWGVAYFYSPGDVISLTAKDATDPTASREGPVALNVTLPIPALKANLTGYALLRDDYLRVVNGVTQAPAPDDLGYALQGDVLLGEAQLTLGGFYQRDNAPKAVATINTGLGFLPVPELNKVNLFSEAIALYGADVLKGSGVSTITIPTVGSKDIFEKVTKYDSSTFYYTGTMGASYSNTDLNFSLRAEYWYNPFGSDDADYAQRAFNTFALGQVAAIKAAYIDPVNTSGRAYGFGDVANPGKHNLTALVSLSKLLGSDVNFSTLVQQNLSDNSGWAKPSFSYSPWDELGLTLGASVVWGNSGTQFPLQFGGNKLSLNVGVNFGTGKF